MSLGRSLDLSLDSGEEIRFKQKNKRKMEEWAKTTNLSYDEVEHVCIIYYKLQLASEGKNMPVRRSTITDFLHNGMDMTEYKMMPYIFPTLDKTVSPYMSMESFVQMMSLFLRGTLDEKITYCFRVYNQIGISDKLIRPNIITLLKGSLFKDNNEYDEEGVKDMVDMLIKRIDVDRDGKISMDDYRKTIKEKPELLQCFGTVLPSRLAVLAFETTFTPAIKKK